MTDTKHLSAQENPDSTQINGNAHKTMIIKRYPIIVTLVAIALGASVISASSVQQQPEEAPKQPPVEAAAAALLAHDQTKQQAEPGAVQQQQSPLAEKPKQESSAAAAAVESKQQQQQQQPDEPRSADSGKRKARAESSDAEPKAPAAPEATVAAAAAAAAATTTAEPAKQASSSKPAEAASSGKSAAAAASKAQQSKSSLAGKSGASKSKLPANLGTVTSTGSGGHYMSKHDAYSAIAEKHGALAQDAMRKSDKRHSYSGGHGGGSSFGSIQKASGLGEMLNPFKGVTDSGLARTLGASMRSIMKSKYSVPAYVASALLGAVALMAFYESPISPLPVPSLPNPPVGRFPPEMPNISPNVQVPFRTNQQQQQNYGQQQNYNQRSLLMGANGLSQQQPQVFFPGQAAAQQRQLTPGSPVQNLASNLLGSVLKQPAAQRKSGPDYDQSTSRSLFGSGGGGGGANSAAASQKVSAPANQQQQQQQQQRHGNSFLSFFGLGPASAGDQLASASSHGSSSGSDRSSTSHMEPKGSQSGSTILSNSHVVNKVRSYFRGPSAGGSSSAAGVSNSNPYDQYQRMSFVQALMKDTAFLPAFLAPGNRKSSSVVASPAATAAAAAAAGNKPTSEGSSSASSSASQPAAVAAASRMQVGNEGQLGPVQALMGSQSRQQQQQQAKTNPAVGGFGIARVAHALLETLSSSAVQRSAPASQERKSAGDEQQSVPPAAMATASLISDILTGGYSAPEADSSYQQMVKSQVQQPQQQQQHHSQQQQQQQQQQPQQSQPQQAYQSSSSQSQSASSSQAAPQQQQQQQQQQSAQNSHSETAQAAASGRSDDDAPIIITADDQLFTANKDDKQQQQSLVRKTRSVGFEYPIDRNTELALRGEPQPSRAAQINNVVDFVADSYTHNRLLFNFVMNQVGLSQAVPYVEQILAPASTSKDNLS